MDSKGNISGFAILNFKKRLNLTHDQLNQSRPESTAIANFTSEDAVKRQPEINEKLNTDLEELR